MEARDIFGDEPDTDEITKPPSMESLVAVQEDEKKINAGLTPMRVTLPEHLRHDTGKEASPPQQKYIRDLLVKKSVNPQLVAEIEQRLDTGTGYRLTSRQASFYIDQLVQFKDSDTGYAFVKPTVEELPVGRYAITKDGDEDEVRFYQVWRGTKYGKPDLIKVYMQHGPDDSELPFRSAMTICKLIIHQGVLECAQRYGREIGSCYRCGRRLTNRISRQLGIGPVCGNRDFGDTFKNLEVIARREIESQGFDPDEVIEIDSEEK
jgi:hypothetical protein